MTSAFDTRQRKFRNWLLMVTGVCNGSFFLFIASITRDLMETWRGAVVLLSFALYVVTLVLLPVMVVWGAWKQRVTKTEAWWWLSGPFVIGFQFSLFIKFDNVAGLSHGLAPVFYLYFIGVVSSWAWALRSGYQAKTRQLIQNEKIMLVLAVIAALAALPWGNLHRAP